MADYLKYLLSPLVVTASLIGLVLGDHWVWLGTAVVSSLLFIDMFLPRDFAVRDKRYPHLYDAIIITTILLGFSQIALLSWQAGHGGWSLGTLIAATINVGIVGFVPVTPAIHEMFHRRAPWQRAFGRWSQVLILDPLRELTHVVTHHLNVATPNDPDTARRGDMVYSYLPRSLALQMKEAWKLDRMVCSKRGVSRISRYGFFFRSTIAVGVFLAACFALGGTNALYVVIPATLMPRVLLEVFNYVGHYGLVTEHPGRFAFRHTWNHLTPIVRILGFEITNHAGHHQDSYRPFYELVPDRDGPQQPHFLLCVLASFVPPIWFAIIRPLLADWDNRFATLQEQELADAENQRCGWVDTPISHAVA